MLIGEIKNNYSFQYPAKQVFVLLRRLAAVTRASGPVRYWPHGSLVLSFCHYLAGRVAWHAAHLPFYYNPHHSLCLPLAVHLSSIDHLWWRQTAVAVAAATCRRFISYSLIFTHAIMWVVAWTTLYRQFVLLILLFYFVVPNVRRNLQSAIAKRTKVHNLWLYILN